MVVDATPRLLIVGIWALDDAPWALLDGCHLRIGYTLEVNPLVINVNQLLTAVMSDERLNREDVVTGDSRTVAKPWGPVHLILSFTFHGWHYYLFSLLPSPSYKSKFLLHVHEMGCFLMFTFISLPFFIGR